MQVRLTTLTQASLMGVVLMGCANGTEVNGPVLDRGQDDPVCSQSLALGKALFQSQTFYLTEPPTPPAGFDSDLLANADGTNGLRVDDQTFDTLSTRKGDAPGIYWQLHAIGYRLVLADSPFNWQGDNYALFVVAANQAQATFLSGLNKGDQSVKPLISGWLPPLVLRDRRDGQVWIIDVGQPYDIPAIWKIWALTVQGAESRCRVLFSPRNQPVPALLPSAVNQLISLLNLAHGDGSDEGTMQMTARIQLSVKQALFNVALRPWVPLQPYNSLAEVDTGLQHWASLGARNQTIYHKIRRQYPHAVQALGEYYQRQLSMQSTTARALAVREIDALYRLSFIFSRSRPAENGR